MWYPSDLTKPGEVLSCQSCQEKGTCGGGFWLQQLLLSERDLFFLQAVEKVTQNKESGGPCTHHTWCPSDTTHVPRPVSHHPNGWVLLLIT